MITFLITGGCGYIGSHTCLSLLERGYNLIIIDSNINSSQNVLERIYKIGHIENNLYKNQITFIKGDIRNYELLKKIFIDAINKNKPISAVIHFAGLKAVEESVKNPLLYWDNNVYGSINLFKAMQSYDCKIIVFSSSATIYGNSKEKFSREDAAIQPMNPYGYTKLTIENILKDIFISSNNGWKIANLRYFNPVGAHESGLIGENPLNIPNNLFPYICRVANKNYKELKIFGNDWNTYDGTCIRDYIHVVDLAEAHCAALDYLIESEPKILNLNIGTGIGTSVLEMVSTFSKVNKIDVPYSFAERRPGDVPSIVADNKLAIKTLNWFPKRDLSEMCRNGWNWQINNPKGYI